MNAQDLESQLSDLESVLRFSWHAAGSPVTRAIRELYATRSASAILSCVHALFRRDIEITRQVSRTEDQSSLRPFLPSLEGFPNAASELLRAVDRQDGSEGVKAPGESGLFALAQKLALTEDRSTLRLPLPTLGAVQRAAPRLLEAVALRDGKEVVRALREMGVFALCPPPEQQFGRLELSVGSIVGRARLIPLVELAVLAAELGVHDRAGIYLAEAHTLSPRPPELHNLYTVAGIIAASGGRLAEAKSYLAKSTRVCREDNLACRARGLNLMLAGKLLELGEKTAVVEFLRQCQGIWIHEAKHIAAWIEAIQKGQKPDFRAPRLQEHPAVKMLYLVSISDFL